MRAATATRSFSYDLFKFGHASGSVAKWAMVMGAPVPIRMAAFEPTTEDDARECGDGDKQYCAQENQTLKHGRTCRTDVGQRIVRIKQAP